jgi:hypothetical protein
VLIRLFADGHSTECGLRLDLTTAAVRFHGQVVGASWGKEPVELHAWYHVHALPPRQGPAPTEERKGGVFFARTLHARYPLQTVQKLPDLHRFEEKAVAVSC